MPVFFEIHEIVRYAKETKTRNEDEERKKDGQECPSYGGSSRARQEAGRWQPTRNHPFREVDKVPRPGLLNSSATQLVRVVPALLHYENLSKTE